MKIKNKIIHKLVYDPIFRSETLFYLCKNGDDIISHSKKKYNININTYSFDMSRGSCIEIECSKTKVPYWIIWIQNKNDWKTMVHESSHLVFRILDKRGIKYDSNNDETWCYLHEYFISRFWNIMCKKK